MHRRISFKQSKAPFGEVGKRVQPSREETIQEESSEHLRHLDFVLCGGSMCGWGMERCLGTDVAVSPIVSPCGELCDWEWYPHCIGSGAESFPRHFNR